MVVLTDMLILWLMCFSARQHVPVTEFKGNLEHMIEHLHTSNIDSIILIAPPPVCEAGRIKHNCQVCMHGSIMTCIHMQSAMHLVLHHFCSVPVPFWCTVMLLNILSYQLWGLGLLTICHGVYTKDPCLSCYLYSAGAQQTPGPVILAERGISPCFPSGEPACSVQAHLLQKLAYQSAQTRLQEPMQLQ